MRKITYGGMMMGEAERKALLKIVDKNWWPLAEEGELFEQEAAAHLGVKHGVVVNSGSSAGLLALAALELPHGSEVIIPATTFPTIFNIILQCGLVPVVVDTEVGTYNLNLDEVEKAISKDTKAIIAVHAVGNPVNMPRLLKIVKKQSHKIYTLEDNCDGWGGTIGTKKVGTFGDVSFTSFHAAHIVSMGQGGGIFTDDAGIAERAKMLRDWGRQANYTKRENTEFITLPKDYDARFIYQKIGYNLSPLELQAAIGRVQLTKTEKIKEMRQYNFDYLYEHLKWFDMVMPDWIPNAKPSWFAFPLAFHDRGSLVRHLESRGIETRSMFAGNILLHPAYADVSYRQVGTLEGANDIVKRAFWVSCHPKMTEADRKYMVKAFYDFFNA